MRKLLYASIPIIMMGCGTSEDSVQTDSASDSTEAAMDSAITVVDSLTIDLPIADSANPIIHGTPDKEKLDSIKNSKKDKKKKE